MKKLLFIIFLTMLLIGCGKTPGMKTGTNDAPSTTIYKRLGEYLPPEFEQRGDIWVSNYTNSTGNYYTQCEKDFDTKCAGNGPQEKRCTQTYFYLCKTVKS